MNTYIALLRGINVGGNKMIAMSALRETITGLGFNDVRTLLQSGNVVFRGARTTTAQLERMLETEFDASVFVRTAAEWKEIIEANPFVAEVKRDPGHLLVMLLKDAPSKEDVKALRAGIVGREIVDVAGRHAYFVYPDGVGRSKLTHALIEKKLGTRGTARNWNTVMKVNALL